MVALAMAMATFILPRRTLIHRRQVCLVLTRASSGLLAASTRGASASLLKKVTSSRYMSPPMRLQSDKPAGAAKVPHRLETLGSVTARSGVAAPLRACRTLLSESESVGYPSISRAESRQGPLHRGRRRRQLVFLGSVPTGQVSLPPMPRYAPHLRTCSSSPL